MFHPGKNPRVPILCYVTDRKGLAFTNDDQSEALLKRVATAAAAGIDWIQIREKDFSGKQLSSLARATVAQIKKINERNGTQTRIIVNDRLDVALSERTDGVHLGENSLPVHDVCKWLNAKPDLAEGDKFLVGVSCHSVQGAVSAARDGADYVFFGPVLRRRLRHHLALRKACSGSPKFVQPYRFRCSRSAASLLITLPIVWPLEPSALQPSAFSRSL